MMHWIVGSSLKLRRVMVVVAAGMLVVGFTQLNKTAVDVLPEFMPPTVEIQVEALGLSANEVEELITVPMEQDLLNGIAFLKTIRSESVEGLASIELIFEKGTDLLSARQLVQERLSEGQGGALPNVSKPATMLQPTSSTSRVMMIGMSSKTLSPIDMGVLARWNIRPRLQGVPGVANVSIWGQRERQLQVLVDPQRLREHGVALQDVIESTGNALWVSPLTYLEASTPGTGGFIDTPNQRLSIQHVLPVSRADDLARITLEHGTGGEGPLVLGDVATVVEDHQPLIGDAVLSGQPGFLLVVEKFPGSSTLEVTKAVEDALEALKPGLGDVQFDASVYRAADYIRSSIDNLALGLIIGALLLLLVLGIFLFDWRAVLITALSISLSMAVALLVLRLRDATVNSIVVAGLGMALVALIDDAVVGVDGIVRRLREPDGDPPRSTAMKIVEATVERRGALLFATLAMGLALVPLLVVKGIAGAFLPTLVASYLLAILSSMVVALTVTPALGMLLLANAPPDRPDPPLVRWLNRTSDRMIVPNATRPVRAIVALGLIAAVGIGMLPIIRRGPALPTFKERVVMVDVEAAPGTSQPEMNRIIGNAATELRSTKGVRNVGAHVGRAVTGDQVVSVNSAEMWVAIDAKADYDATLRSIKDVVAGYPGLDKDVLVYSSERVQDILTGVETDVVVRAFGEDLKVLTAKAQEIQKMLGGIAGVVDPLAELPTQEPSVEIEPLLAAAQQHGVRPGDIRRSAAWLLSGLEVGKLFEQNKVFEVVVWSTPEVRSRIEDIRELPVDKPDGTQVRLGDVADVRITANPSIIKHEAVSRAIDVTANVRGRSLDAVVADIKTGLRKLNFPLEYHAEVLQDPVQRQADARRLLLFAVAAALGVLLLLQATLGSWRAALLVFLTLPVALAGGLVGAALGDRAVSIATIGGLGAVVSVTLRNGVLLLRRYRALEREGGDDLGAALVAQGARERFAPTILTAVATIATLAPMLLMGSRAGAEMLRPMAAVIVGGLVTSTIVTAFALPSLYLKFRAEPGMRSVDDDVELARATFLLWEEETVTTGTELSRTIDLTDGVPVTTESSEHV